MAHYDSTQNRHNAVRMAHREIMNELRQLKKENPSIRPVSNRKMAEHVADRVCGAYAPDTVYSILFKKRTRI